MLSINSILHGLGFLFLDPNPEDPLNKEAAQLMTANTEKFKQDVARAIRFGTTFAPPELNLFPRRSPC